MMLRMVESARVPGIRAVRLGGSRRRAGRLLVSLAALVGVGAPSAVAIEARRRAAEGSPPATQAGRRTAPGGIRAVVRGVVMVGMVMVAAAVLVEA